MNKYTRKQINKNPDRFRNAEFVLYEDAHYLLQAVTKAAVNAGADESKLMEFFEDETN